MEAQFADVIDDRIGALSRRALLDRGGPVSQVCCLFSVWLYGGPND